MEEYINDKLGLTHDITAVFLKTLTKFGVYRRPVDDLERFTSFDEYPVCDMCGSERNHEVLRAIDGSRIVACEGCSLWFTSPRIEEQKWMEYLFDADSKRNRELTENRIKYGVAMPRNIKLALSGWFKRHRRQYIHILDIITKHSKKPISRLHDVGCGVGFFLLVCREMGIEASGNDLNRYAVEVMRSRFDLNVFDTVLQKVPLQTASVDAIVMNAYIEHSYHPLVDLRSAYNLLKQNGVIYISTFHTDSCAFDKWGSKWDMFAWNHVFHFSSNTLTNMVNKAGFHIILNNMKYEIPVSYIIGQKM